MDLLSRTSHAPSAQIPADHNKRSDVMTKKLMLCPISSQEPGISQQSVISCAARHLKRSNEWYRPLSVTFKKNVIVMPTYTDEERLVSILKS